jgi:V/A-type H+-transporting ATPase subunit A
MTKTIGTVAGVNGNMVTVRAQGTVTMNEVAYIVTNGRRLKSEVIRVQAETVQVQVFEITRGIQVGDEVEFTGELLSVKLGPGLLGQIYDGLQNPLPLIAAKSGNFLEPGVYLDALPRGTKWTFSPLVKPGDRVERADTLGQWHSFISILAGGIIAQCNG